MIYYSIVRLGETRVAAALVEKRDLVAPQRNCLIRRLEEVLRSPVMLIARDESDWVGARAYAHFDADPYFYALMQACDIDWCEVQSDEYELAE